MFWTDDRGDMCECLWVDPGSMDMCYVCLLSDLCTLVEVNWLGRQCRLPRRFLDCFQTDHKYHTFTEMYLEPQTKLYLTKTGKQLWLFWYLWYNTNKKSFKQPVFITSRFVDIPKCYFCFLICQVYIFIQPNISKEYIYIYI